MRAAIVALLCAVLASPAAASPRNAFLSSRKLADTGSLSCYEAALAVSTCFGSYGSESAARGACCGTIDSLVSACGGDLYTAVGNIVGLGQSTADTFANLNRVVKAAMNAIGGCAREGESIASCNAALAAAGECATSSGGETCCNLITAEVSSCVGLDLSDSFWEGVKGHAEATGCPVFSATMCTNAAMLLNRCAATFPTALTDNCCNAREFQDMFCTNIPSAIYAPLLPDAQAQLALAACEDRNGNSGDGNSQCNAASFAPNFAWYNTATGGFVITNQASLAVDPSEFLYQDANAVKWYVVDLTKAPNAAKLVPRDVACSTASGRR